MHEERAATSVSEQRVPGHFKIQAADGRIVDAVVQPVQHAGNLRVTARHRPRAPGGAVVAGEIAAVVLQHDEVERVDLPVGGKADDEVRLLRFQRPVEEIGSDLPRRLPGNAARKS